jgi:hypothetical protein
MSMRKIIILTFIIISNSCIAQTVNKEFNKQIKDITLSIRRNLPLKNPDKLIKKSEYFIFDLTLKEDGGIKNIDILRRDSSYNISSIRPILSIIKNKWMPIKSKYYKVFIPLIFTFEEEEDINGNILDENGTFGIDYFFKYLKNNDNKIYVSERISIHFSEPKK